MKLRGRTARSICFTTANMLVAAGIALSLSLGGNLAWAQEDLVEDLDELLEAPVSDGDAEGTDSLDGLDELDDLEGLGEGAGDGLSSDFDDLGGLGGFDAPISESEATPASPPALRLTFNGYVKPLAVWEKRTFPENFSVPDKDRFTTVGARSQLRLQGNLRGRAQFFTAVNLDFNEVDQDNDTASTESESGKLRMVESYIDLFGESTRWRIGSQLVTWGFMDGFEVPTDRLNARDFSFKSSELEDLKLASTGVEFRWTVGSQRLELYYIPVAKVNRLAPDFERIFDRGQTQGREATPRNGKYATRLGGTVGSLDYALTYVDGVNPRPDLGEVDPPEEDEPDYFKIYERAQSSGLDLQLELGDTLLRFSGVYWNTGDLKNDDPLLQNDWWQAMTGMEFWLGAALVNLNIGRRQVIDHDTHPDHALTNILISQTAGNTNVIAGSFTDSYLTGDALEVTLLYAYLWEDDGGGLVAGRARPSFVYNFGDGVAFTLIPGYFDEVGIITQELYSELKFSF